MGKCRECGTEVSDQAKVCPKCGVSRPVRKTSLLVKLLAVLFGLFILGRIFGGGAGSGSPSTSSSEPSPPDPKAVALDSVKLEKLNWTKGGFDSVMLLTTTIKNGGARSVKDLVIECTHYSNSGTRIDSNKKTVFERIDAGKSFRLKEFGMGFIHSQASSTSCAVVDLVLL
ncbi:MAG: zinc ribbon domain-containing protein [Burkholderiales bacterium]|nr:zinc ribbon domain-containing protein [Burkholderiales bacterium]